MIFEPSDIIFDTETRKFYIILEVDVDRRMYYYYSISSGDKHYDSFLCFEQDIKINDAKLIKILYGIKE